MQQLKHYRLFFLIVFFFILAAVIALPKEMAVDQTIAGRQIKFTVQRPIFRFNFLGQRIEKEFELKQGLDIQGGMQVVLRADMAEIAEDRRADALSAVQEVIRRRVDLFGVSEPLVQTAQSGDEQRIIVELAGVQDQSQALALIGTTAQLDFRLQAASPSAEATQSAEAFFGQFDPSGLTGKQLSRASVQYSQQTGAPEVLLEFNEEGTKQFAEITKNYTGRVLAIFLDEYPVSMPVIQTSIPDGRAVISGTFGIEEAKQLSIQLNAGALPVPVAVVEQRSIGASLGQEAVRESVRAGMIGLAAVVIFMIIYYGWKGVLSSISLVMYAVFTIALYKLIGVTLTLPGIAGLILTIGMAVDSNILIFERMKEELRNGQGFTRAMELGFGRAWDSIKDANVATIFTALVLINPLDFQFLNTSGLVRGFGVTLLIGVLTSLFTGLVVTRTLMRLFLSEGASDVAKKKAEAKS